MSRDQARENAALRARLRDTTLRLQLLAQAVAQGDDAAQPLARLLLAGTLEADGVSQVPPSTTTREPEAGTLHTNGEASHG